MASYEGEVEILEDDDAVILEAAPARIWTTAEVEAGWRGTLQVNTDRAGDIPDRVTLRLEPERSGDVLIETREPGEGPLAVTTSMLFVGDGPAPFSDDDLPRTPAGRYTPEPFDSGREPERAVDGGEPTILDAAGGGSCAEEAGGGAAEADGEG